ncbi:MAG: 2-amino-4-hydroxy-6-hydroxymethyldihydropteridine diphosphokinase [Bacteriovorax sp.]
MSPFHSFFIASGSNLGDRKLNLEKALALLQKHFDLIASSRIYESPAVDYLNQPDFYNQVLEFKIPPLAPDAVITLLLEMEKELGRNRLIPKGPRLIDLDILFWGVEKFSSEMLEIPHPRLFERSFVVLPLSELPGFEILRKNFTFNFQFDNHASPLS